MRDHKVVPLNVDWHEDENAETAILRTMKPGEIWSVERLATATNRNHRSVNNAMAAMKRAGKIEYGKAMVGGRLITVYRLIGGGACTTGRGSGSSPNRRTTRSSTRSSASVRKLDGR